MHIEPGEAWTPVILSADLPPGMVVPATIGAGGIALWRSRSGQVLAMADRCPHRGMRLSHGFVRGEALSCIYHGWRYGEDGRCLRIPAHPGLTPPDAIRVPTFSAAEAGGLIWIAGDASSSTPPDLGDLVPLRSLTIDAGFAEIEAAAGGAANAQGLLAFDGGRTMLLAARGTDSTLAHLLARRGAAPEDRIAASRAAEALRRRAEAFATERAT